MKFLNHQSGLNTICVVSVAVLLNATLCGGSKKRFCNCAFDCLTEEGIEYHNVTLSGKLTHAWPNEQRI